MMFGFLPSCRALTATVRLWALTAATAARSIPSQQGAAGTEGAATVGRYTSGAAPARPPRSSRPDAAA